MRHLTMLLLLQWVLCLGRPSEAAPFTPGNLLVTRGNQLLEYTREGVLVQFLEVPHPDTGRRDATDVVVDRLGRAHVLNIAPFDPSYLSSYDPVGQTWSHVLLPANTSFGSLSILDDMVFTRGHRIEVTSGQVSELPVQDYGKVSVGLDGLLYAAIGERIDVLDSESFARIRSLTLRDRFGERIDVRGVAANVDGRLYAASWDGRIYAYAADGQLLDEIRTFESLRDIDISTGGRLAAGSRFGQVFLTDITLREIRSPESPPGLPGGFSGVGFVPDEAERPDDDGDDVLDLFDNCPADANPPQENRDDDEFGDTCDPFPDDPENLEACLAAMDDCERERVSAEAVEGDLASGNQALVRANQRLEEQILGLEFEEGQLTHALEECLVDPDRDGVPVGRDLCPSTRAGRVDDAGCSQDQFCAAHSGSGPRAPLHCLSADWSANGAATRSGADCGPGPGTRKGETRCVPRVGQGHQ